MGNYGITGAGMRACLLLSLRRISRLRESGVYSRGMGERRGGGEVVYGETEVADFVSVASFGGEM